MEGQNTSVFQNEVLYGKDDEHYLVAAHQISDTHIRLYSRQDGRVSHRDEPFFPFFFFENRTLLDGFLKEKEGKVLNKSCWIQNLSGTNEFRHLAIFKGNREYRRALDTLSTEQRSTIYDKADIVSQYLNQTGKTFFKGMGLNDVRRMQLDIETYYKPMGSTFGEKGIGADPIIIIALSDNTGWEKVLHASNQSEQDLLLELISVIHERNPDVIEGHNIYAFDLPYIQKRCEKLGVVFGIGRDGSEPRSFPTSVRFAERTLDYPCFEIAGRHIIDTFFLIQFFDVAKRALPSYGLKQVAKYFGFASEERTYVDYKDMANAWDNQREKLLAYALDDVRETSKLANMLSGSYFYLTQMLPFSYAQVSRTGPAAKIEALFVRNYLREKRSLPKPRIGEQKLGGLTRVYLKGILGPIVYADVESLYPSVMLSYNICPKTDEAKLFPKLLSDRKDMRFMAKDKMKEESRK
ncbi:hypothetical protein CHS0354_000484 [Potamilus streckersoni]|uniref:DNA polymerase delta catalytic subunit n=1 Tax=Potamilus streckersoni TaxID=2493646 RepID=A0AAE0T6S6_9BIVA|nr:hypothetical protein CHS0354_000484 [Potamilus streckersoni]